MTMKACFALIGALLLLAQSGLGQGSAVIIKQRARELSNQNNVRQGVASPAPAVQTGAAADADAPARPLTPQEKILARIQSDLSAMKPGSSPTTGQRLQLGKDLMAAVQGSAKPSQTAANHLALDLASTLEDKLLATVTVKRLVQDLNAVLNPSTVDSTQLTAVIADVQAIFQADGVERKEAVTIANDARTIVAEIKKAAAAAP